MQCLSDLPDHPSSMTVVYPAWDIHFLQTGDLSENLLQISVWVDSTEETIDVLENDSNFSEYVFKKGENEMSNPFSMRFFAVDQKPSQSQFDDNEVPKQ